MPRSTVWRCPPAGSIDLVAALGPRLLRFWQVPLDPSPLVTLNGGNTAQLNDRVASPAHMAQASVGAQPLYHADGFGPNSRPWIETQDAARYLSAAVSIPAGNRAGFFFVGKCGDNNGFYTLRITHVSGGQTRLHCSSTVFGFRVQFTGGQQVPGIADPPKDLLEHLFAILPASTGAKLEIDGAETTSNLSGTDTLTEITTVAFGSPSSLSDAGAGLAMLAIVNDPTPPKVAIVESFVEAYYGMDMA